jgi:predicted nucleotidyltransferase
MQKPTVSLNSDFIERIVNSVISAVPTEKIYLFGSYARGEATPDSDVDIYVVTKDTAESRFAQMGRIGMALLWMGMPKDVLAGPVDHFEARKDNLFNIEYTVSREGVVIYG